ncbi:MAG: hypothetical protein LBR27_11360 [Bifidobacteriaceae bacterium]|jgi:uncharacterized membrane protein YphA (DoxX/SURF4 family)|nr:hypothetical protein [Bifidobacteriaceae bacterium]
MSLLRIAARALVGAAIIQDAASALKHPAVHVEAATPYLEQLSQQVPQIPNNPALAVKVLAGAQAAGGGLVASGLLPRGGAALAAAALAPSTALGHQFWRTKDKTERAAQLQAFMFKVALLGGALAVLTAAKKRGAKKACCAKKAAQADQAKAA